MPFPVLEGKHEHESLFSPEDYVKWRKLEKQKAILPKKYIIIYSKTLLKHFIRKFCPRLIKVSHHKIYVYDDVGVIKINGIGAPNAVVTFEEIIAVGGKYFFNIGFAGGMDDFGIYICNKAIRDEGTSLHYLPHEKYAYPDKHLTEALMSCLKRNNISYKVAPTWTIDAPYRETKAEIESYRKEGVATVEMETSALFVVAKVRKVKIASAFVVSDLLSEKWNPIFDAKKIKKQLYMLFDIALECMINI